MALLGSGSPYLLAASNPGWQYDSNNNDLVPITGGNAVQDLGRSIGRQTGSGTAISRALVNQMLPTGVYMAQTVPGAEKNTFTTRVAIQGTLVNLGTIGDGTQTAGTFPAGALNVLGRIIRITGGGTTGTTGTPAFTYDIGLGSGVLATTGSQTRIAATSPQNFWFQVVSTVTTTGSSGVVNSSGVMLLNSTALVGAVWQFANSTVGTGLSADLTTALAISFNATCGTSDVANRVILNSLMVEVLN